MGRLGKPWHIIIILCKILPLNDDDDGDDDDGDEDDDADDKDDPDGRCE